MGYFILIIFLPKVYFLKKVNFIDEIYLGKFQIYDNSVKINFNFFLFGIMLILLKGGSETVYIESHQH